MKKIFYLVLFLAAPLMAAPKIAVTMSDGSLQSGTTGFHVSSGTVLSLRSSTATITNLTVSTFTSTGYISASSITTTSLSATTLSISSFTTTNLQSTNLRVTTATWKGFGVLPILQIQQYVTTTSTLTTNTGYTNTTLTGSFTPKISTSKTFILASGTVRQNVGDNGFFTISRDGVNLSGSANGLFGTTSNNNYDMCIFDVDLPSTTSAVTYTVQFKTAGGGGSIELSPSIAGTVNESSMMVVEIAQ